MALEFGAEVAGIGKARQLGNVPEGQGGFLQQADCLAHPHLGDVLDEAFAHLGLEQLRKVRGMVIKTLRQHGQRQVIHIVVPDKLLHCPDQLPLRIGASLLGLNLREPGHIRQELLCLVDGA
ncbi:hypothetical protein D3C76_1584020 [compost metagenome]